jgi:hypothetical protein
MLTFYHQSLLLTTLCFNFFSFYLKIFSPNSPRRMLSIVRRPARERAERDFNRAAIVARVFAREGNPADKGSPRSPEKGADQPPSALSIHP